MASKLPSTLSSNAGHLPPIYLPGREETQSSNLKAEDPGDKRILQQAHKISQGFLQPRCGHVAECQEVNIQY